MTTEELSVRAAALEETFVALRREIHAYPETAQHEEKTATLVEKALHSFGIETVRRGNCVLGVLQGERAGRTVVLRADMDALPTQEQSELPFASQCAGICHACGHDIHTAALLFAAKLLSECRNTLCGTVKLLFQPAEETLSGALLVLNKTNFLDNADAIFAMHTWPELPEGSVGVRFGSMMAAADTFSIKILAQGGHAAHPQHTADPVLTAAYITTQLHTIVARELSPLESAVLTVGEFHAGSAPNIIPPEAILRGTVRSMAQSTRQKMQKSIERIAKLTAESLRAEASVEYRVGCPPLCGTDKLVSIVERAAQKVVGAERVFHLEKPSLGSEDFAYYLQKIPGAFFRIGTYDDRPESRLALHDPRIIFGEGSIRTGAMTLTTTAILYLTGQW